MTRLRIFNLVLMASLVTACAKQASDDYCKNHQEIHDSHTDSIGKLTVVVSEDGKVRSTLILPIEIFDETPDLTVASKTRLRDALAGADKVFRVQAAGACKETASELDLGADPLSARYEVDCGTDTGVGRIDVSVFDNLPELEEVEVHVTTPATEKHFAISRQCDSAIFRLETRSDD